MWFDGVKFQDLPYRDMEKLRQVGLFTTLHTEISEFSTHIRNGGNQTAYSSVKMSNFFIIIKFVLNIITLILLLLNLQ